ncbi:MAG: hypothetical protein BWZ10_02962 [candidate division BRC1 bacterium ADurb.BinA364]|nr:MAG: hypothetical protein BWZ10_02962 [candidate division BRC1 bacterium ADurb.BinA364]
MGSPARIAALINEAPYEGPPCDETYFDWTVVHAWSRFLDIGDSDDPLAEIPPPNRSAGGLSEAEGGVGPVQWLMRRLAPHVRVVAPEALLLLMRLHLRTAETLGLYLNGIERGLARMDAFALDEPNRARLEAHGLLEDARAAIERLGCDPPEQDKQAAFEAVRRAYAHAECARLALARFERRGEYVYCLAPPPIPDPFFYSFREGLAEYLGAAEACDHLAADRLEIRFSASPDEQVDMALTDIPLPISALRGRLARARIVSFQGRFHSPWIELPRSIEDAVREVAGNPDG